MSGVRYGIAAIALSLLAGCTTTETTEDVRNPTAGFATVASRATDAIGAKAVWVQSSAESDANTNRVKGMVRGKTIDIDTAVQVALLNNRGLQAAYFDIGLAAADVWQESLLVNPRVAVGVMGIDVARTIEATVVTNILAVLTRPNRVAIADTRFRQAQLRAAEETLRVAYATRKAWTNAVAARETVAYLDLAQVAADAASELARKLGETGAFTKSGQAREHVFNAELAGQTAEARLAARLAKEDLTRLMGLWGYDVDYVLPGKLPALPNAVAPNRTIEAEALKNRVDLEVARLELEALAKAHKLTSATRYVTDLELMAGIEVERETEEDGSVSTKVSANAELEFVIPIFDTGQARMRKAEAVYMQAANRLAEMAVNVRSDARVAYEAYRSTYDIARHYRASVVPLRAKIEEESVLTYNGMITNTFELLADTRAKIDSNILSLNAKRAFWLAVVDVAAAVNGGGSAGTAVASAQPSGAGGGAGGGH